MLKRVKIAVLAASLTTITACTTTGKFVVPEGSDLYIHERPVTPDSNGQVVTKPFFWSSIAGVKYRVEKDGETVKQGKLRAKFRPVSIFWPPAALIYWPAGLNPDITYDLVNDTQK